MLAKKANEIRGELFTMSQEEINLLCTNRGLISPLRVCVRVCARVSAGCSAPAQNAQVKMPDVRVRVSAGGLP